MNAKQETNTGIALNIVRTRVTILVFNLTIIALMLSVLSSRSRVTGYDAIDHLSTGVALFVGFCLTILGVFWLLSSQTWDAQGLSRPWPFTLGAISTYLALSQTITAFMHEYLLSVETAMETTRPVIAGNSILPYALGDSALQILFIMGATIWTLTTYIGPLMVTLKSPVNTSQRWVFAGYYCMLQIPVYWVYARAWSLQYVPADQPMNIWLLFTQQFFQPLLWLY